MAWVNQTPELVLKKIACDHSGNAEADGFAGAPGTMEAIYFGNDSQWWREWPTGAQHQRGPFIMADFEGE